MEELKPEFELLNSQFKQLYDNVGVDQEFLERVKGNVELCEHVAELEDEKSIIAGTVYWWERRAKIFGMTMKPKLPPSLNKTREQIAEFDRKFLRSLRIFADELPEDENDGA